MICVKTSKTVELIDGTGSLKDEEQGAGVSERKAKRTKKEKGSEEKKRTRNRDKLWFDKLSKMTEFHILK